MRLHDVCHAIDHLLQRIVTPEHRIDVLEFVRSGYEGETGRFIGRSEDSDRAIRCTDCSDRRCKDCAVKQHCETEGKSK